MKEKAEEAAVFERGTLKVKVEPSERRGRLFVTVDERCYGLTTEEMEALGRFLLNSARRLSR